MLEIAPSHRPPLAMLLAVVLPLLALAGVPLWRATRRERLRLLAGALALGGLLTAASAGLWSRRHAGTGTETAWGWPRIVYARWVPFEDGAGRAGLQWRGVAECGLTYATLGAVLLTLRRTLAQRRPAEMGAPSVPT